MKFILRFSSSLLILFISFYIFSCNSTAPQNKEIRLNAFQVGGCNSTALAKTTKNDSCFSYSFDDTLKIDFCVMANCCPDSQRFVTDYNIKSDVIFFSVTDTAANLCDCICNYTIHLDLVGLPKNQYLFQCNYQNKILYKEYVNK